MNKFTKSQLATTLASNHKNNKIKEYVEQKKKKEIGESGVGVWWGKRKRNGRRGKCGSCVVGEKKGKKINYLYLIVR